MNKRSMQEYADREKCTDAEERRLEGIFRWKTAEGSLGAGRLKAIISGSAIRTDTEAAA